MATTGTIIFPVQGAKLPTANAALIDGGETNWRLLFDDSATCMAWWQFRMPHDYNAAGNAFIQYSTLSGVSNAIAMGVAIMAITPGDAVDVNTESFATYNTGAASGVWTVGQVYNMTIPLTSLDSLAANDFVKVRLLRDVGATDSLTGQVEVLNFTMEYLTT